MRLAPRVPPEVEEAWQAATGCLEPPKGKQLSGEARMD